MVLKTMSSSKVLPSGAEVQQVVSTYVEAEGHLRKLTRCLLECGTQTIETTTQSTAAALPKDDVDELTSSKVKSGRWSLDEKLMFLYGLSLFGKGRWKKIHAYVPDRSLVQIKSHAQKVLKRVEAGENVFQRLQDNHQRMKELVTEANRRIEEKAAKLHAAPIKKRKRTSAQTSLRNQLRKAEDCPSSSASPVPSLSLEDPPGVYASQEMDEVLRIKEIATRRPETVPTKVGMPSDGTGAIFAAVAALCQLSARVGPQ